jgi:hypothetical protein
MAYQKTAKDLAWDKERQKLKTEIHKWVHNCAQKEEIIQSQVSEIKSLNDRIHSLEIAIAELTKGEMSPDEAIVNMRKRAELSDNLNILFKLSKGIM